MNYDLIIVSSGPGGLMAAKNCCRWEKVSQILRPGNVGSLDEAGKQPGGPVFCHR